ncbi:hemerythrin domain-containing protein [Microbulbifer sp. OS29]|uniref:Hemerythrin domain-containing protein n=1 Tax=Microbulbifer okhotskensis TaxID=2926617 RepID=A0A9X2EQ89_9GAMM|nr:hemerythrin domain-containing protein [Microbulbifer okhotskensis]MCO1333606.1 hemerythrin domain-containing protein [Microbulbifer okhotskensis]
MNTIYRQLCCDHKQMQQLLNAFEQLLLDLFGRTDRDPSTLSLILDALDYLSVYPDQYHHPIEDLIFARLLTKPIHDKKSIYEAQMQHEQIALNTKHMCALFYAIANDATVERRVLQGACTSFLKLQRSHMNLENTAIFPQIEQYLDLSDWITIQKQVNELNTKYFDHSIRKIYESLHEHLTQAKAPEQALA